MSNLIDEACALLEEACVGEVCPGEDEQYPCWLCQVRKLLEGVDAERRKRSVLVCQACKRSMSRAKEHLLCPCGSEDFYNKDYFDRQREHG